MLPRSLALSLVLAISAVFAETRLALYLDVAAEPSAPAMDEMKRQVETLLGPSGVRIDWRLLGDTASRESATDLYVIRLRGTCDANRVHVLYSELGPYGEAAILGSTDTVDTRLQPFGQLECDNLRLSLARDLRTVAQPDRDALFGRALGRVLAHELFHMITGTSHHAKAGLFKAGHSRRELLAATFAFDPAEQEQLRRRFAARN